jgi:dipeptidyl aminopeptidase/acylaminoacyl peptidase
MRPTGRDGGGLLAMTGVPASTGRIVSGAKIPSLLAALVLLVCFFASAAAERSPASGLPDDIVELLTADPLSPVVVDPGRRFALLVRARQLVSLDSLAEPVVTVLGRRINPNTGAVHAPLEYYGLELVDLGTGAHRRLKLPGNGPIAFPQWSPDGSRFSFTVTRSSGMTELWIGDPVAARMRMLRNFLNASRGQPCRWTPDSRHLLCRRSVALRSVQSTVPVPEAETVAELVASQVLAREPVPLGERTTRELLESQLELIDADTAGSLRIGRPAAIETAEAAPAGAFLLVERIHKPYPEFTNSREYDKATEVWDRFGNVVWSLPATARAVRWHAAEPATLLWVEHRDGADRLLSLRPPYRGTPTEVFELPGRFSGMRWIGDSNLALVGDFDAPNRRTSLWLVDLGGAAAQPRRILTHASEDSMSPVMGFNARGMRAVVEQSGAIYLSGVEKRGGDTRNFLDRLTLRGGQRQRLWTGRSERFEKVVDVLDAAAARLLIRTESPESPPNYVVTARRGQAEWALTHRQNPAPPLAEAERMRLQYARDDGLELGATLHVPAGCEPDDRLPLIVWAYPRRSLPGHDASVTDGTRRFPSFERAFRLYFLLRGFAVLDDVSMPIVGTITDANDTFTQQIIANARAAIRAAGDTGYVDTGRVGIAGHSYGAFMVANLLAHSNLFRAGVALSGAYNRTLTPFGFQTEQRTLWEAPDTYLSMSPLLFADRIAAPLLLVHGLMDDNAGTAPIQSIQFYQAIRGNGGDAQLLLLPWEGHEYRARESVMKTAERMLEWFEANLVEVAVAGPDKETGASLRPL